MENITYTFNNLTIFPFPFKPSVPRKYIRANNFLSTLTDEQLATIGKEIYDDISGSGTRLLCDWLNESTRLPNYHSPIMAQNMVIKEIIRRYINSTEYSEDC